MPKIIIRKIRKNDIEHIALLHDEFEGYLRSIDRNRESERIDEFKLRMIRDAFSQKKYYKGFIALEKNVSLGYILFHDGYDPDEMSGPIVYVIDLIVTKEKRKKGIGKMLIEKVKEYCKFNNIKNIYLYCWKKNIDAVQFYDKMDGERITDLFVYKI